MRIKYLDSFDPYFHLALEYYYLYEDRDIKHSPVLLIYRNQPCVVFGNFQNPWRECDVPYCFRNNISLVRRFSGGGCVYHDLGNINFSLISYGSMQKDKPLSKYLLDFFKLHQIPVIEGQKSDLLLNHHKISGSAFRQIKNANLHHCTLLFNSNLNDLELSLKSKILDSAISTKALDSRRAKVAAVGDYRWSRVEEFIDEFIDYLEAENIIQLPLVDASVWKSWEQIWGKTPNFKLMHQGLELEVESGYFKKIIFKGSVLKIFDVRLPMNLADELLSLNLDKSYYDWLKNIGVVYQ